MNRFIRPCFIVAVALAVFFGPDAARAQSAAGMPIPERAAAVITPLQAQAHVEALASDRMLGRNTPGPELDSAARYIEAALRSYGVEPVTGSYVDEYYLLQQDLGATNSLVVNGKAFNLRTAFVPYDFSGSGKVAGDVVFAGFGISRPDSGYDDYAGIDARGKIVLAIAGEPEPPGGVPMDHRSRLTTPVIEKSRIASRHGAVGFMLLANPLESKFLRPGGYPWRAFFQRNDAVQLGYQLEIRSPVAPIPSVGINGEVAREILGMSVEHIGDIVRHIDSTQRPASFAAGKSAEMEVEITQTRTPVHNVVGMIRGRQYPDEYVVIGAHYDHIGHYQPGKSAASAKADTIYNGADDNASGTAGLLLAAQAFGSLPPGERPARSILFIAFSGEEKGLYGSRAYVADPLVPLGSTVAMLNMDMIGRNFRDSISVAGGTRSKDLLASVVAANTVEPFTMAENLEEMFFRSDQASFASKRIPSIFFSSGLHADYHAVTDSPEKIDSVKLAHVARLCFRTAWLVAESARRPVYNVQADDAGANFSD